MPFVNTQATVVATDPSDACGTLTNCQSLDQSIAYVDVNGDCEFTDRAKAVQVISFLAFCHTIRTTNLT